MPWVIETSVDGAKLYRKREWCSLQASFNRHGFDEPPREFEEYHAGRALGLTRREAWERVMKKMKEEGKEEGEGR